MYDFILGSVAQQEPSDHEITRALTSELQRRQKPTSVICRFTLLPGTVNI